MTYDITTTDLQEQATAVVSAHVEHDGIGAFLEQAFDAVLEALKSQSAQVAGHPFARYGASDSGGWEIEAGFPVSAPIAGEGDVKPSRLPGGFAAELVHTGSYDTVAQGWEAITAWVNHNGYVPSDPPWECYLDGPEVPEPRTLILMPCHRPENP